MDLQSHIERFRKRFAELESELAKPDLYDDARHAQEVTRDHSRLRQTLATAERYLKLKEELADAEAMAAGEDEEMAEMAREELEELRPAYERAEQEMRFAIIPPDPTDSRNTIVEIRAGAGGDESALFSGDLVRMYTRHAERQNWKAEMLEASPGSAGGFKEVTLLVSGEDAYKRLKYESGVHRVQRVPATESQGRIHTSTATVAVLPEAEEIDIEIKPEDLDIQRTRSGGPGGQGVNTTDSKVQIFHKPSGEMVACQESRSAIKNQERAMSILRSRLLKRKQEEEAAKYAAQRKSQIGSGDRSEKIRTYNFPQNRVTDHRINYTSHNLPELFDGDLYEMTDSLFAADMEDRLAALEEGV